MNAPIDIDVIVALRRRGLGRHLLDRVAAVRAVGPDVEKAAAWLLAGGKAERRLRP